MKLIFMDNAWEDYWYWRKTDKLMLKKINQLIKEISRNPFEGIGKPEALRVWSRRINHEHRLVYRFEDEEIIVFQCRYHY